jgi:diguanylate cyclase (GGDEF)-like protein/PAS domain S-box-containing protein
LAKNSKVDIGCAIDAFSALFEDAIVFLDEEGRIISANEKWTITHNFQGKEIKNILYEELFFDEENRAKFRNSFNNVIKSGVNEDIAIDFSKNKGSGNYLKEINIKKLQCSEKGSCIAVIEKDALREKDSDKLLLATYRIASSAVVSETLNELFSSIHQTISQLIDARNFYIALYDPKKNMIEFPYFIDEYDEQPGPEPLGKNLTSYVLRTGKPLLVDPQKFEELVSKGEVVIDGAPSIDWLGVPLLSNGVAIGAIVVQSYSQQKRYGQKEVDLLSFVSGQIAFAIEKKRTLEALKESEERLRALAESTSAGIMIIQNENVKYINQSAIAMLGYDENEIYNKKFWEFLRDDYKDWVRNRYEARTKGATDIPSSYEIVAITKAGKEVWLQLTVSIITYEGGKATLVTAFDVSSRKEAEFFLKESEERFRTLAETTSAAIFMFKGQWIIYSNAAAEKLTGYTKKELMALQFWDLIHPDDYVEINQDFSKQMKKGGSFSFSNLRILTKRGEEKWISLKGGVSQMEGETVVIATGFDITQIVQAQENLKYLAHHDYLTGLENRWAFHENLLKSMEESEERGKNIAVLFLDIDRFKELNDTEGHIIGDKILRAAGSRLFSVIEEGTSVARIGSDEFTIILKNTSPQEAERCAARILSAFDEPFAFAGKEFHISLSIGICMYPHDGEDLETLLKNADMAMFRAKAEGGSTYQFYRQEMSEEAKEKIDLRNRLFGAIERNELALYFQPIYEGTDKLVGFEALLRWFDPKLGTIPPDKFIPIAEESGLIVPLGEWVLNVACTHIKNLQLEGHKNLRVSVNLSAKQFHRRDLLDVLEKVLARVGLNPSFLELEITERTAVMDLESTTAMLYALSTKGVRLAIDDFGAGYSSMTYLKRFPIHCLKIDMSFIKDIERDPKDRAIVEAIITMAHGLGLEVVAEGVETEGQLRILSEIGCDHFQGHYFGKAEPMNSFNWGNNSGN